MRKGDCGMKGISALIFLFIMLGLPVSGAFAIATGYCTVSVQHEEGKGPASKDIEAAQYGNERFDHVIMSTYYFALSFDCPEMDGYIKFRIDGKGGEADKCYINAHKLNSPYVVLQLKDLNEVSCSEIKLEEAKPSELEEYPLPQ